MVKDKDNHTWELSIRYHRCPNCGYIIESCQNYTYRLGKEVKELVCERCGKFFTEYRQSHPAFGPLLGKPQSIEMDWS